MASRPVMHILCISCWRWNTHRSSGDGRCVDCPTGYLVLVNEQQRQDIERSIQTEEYA